MGVCEAVYFRGEQLQRCDKPATSTVDGLSLCKYHAKKQRQAPSRKPKVVRPK